MKKHLLAALSAVLLSAGAYAQLNPNVDKEINKTLPKEPAQQPAPEVKSTEQKTTVKTNTNTVKTTDGREERKQSPAVKKKGKYKKDKMAQRRHAEERSKGNAFSGKGKGGEKNLKDPEKKSTK